MPFAAPTVLDEQDPNKKNQSGGVNISGQSASFQSNVPGQEATESKGASEKSSGQYTNIQSYLDANKTQADSMGQNITGQITQKAEDANQKISSFQAQAPKVEAYDPNKVLGNVTQVNDADKAQYKQIKQTGGYTGPQSVDQAAGYQDTVKAAQLASQDVKNAGNEFGQQQLLKKTYTRPDYSAGQTKLDQVLLQNSAGSKAALEGLAQKYAGLDQALSGATQSYGTAINDANQAALQNKKNIAQAEAQAKKFLLDPIQARADQTNTSNSELIGRISKDLGDDELSEETLRILGINDGQKLYDLNLGNYFNQDLTQAGLNNVANAEERQKYAALQGLFEDPTMNQIDANGKEIKAVGFNKEKFDKDLSGKKLEHENQIEGVKSWYTGRQAEIGQKRDGYAHTILQRNLAGMGLANMSLEDARRFAPQIAALADEQAAVKVALEFSDLDKEFLNRTSNVDQMYGLNRNVKKG